MFPVLFLSRALFKLEAQFILRPTGPRTELFQKVCRDNRIRRAKSREELRNASQESDDWRQKNRQRLKRYQIVKKRRRKQNSFQKRFATLSSSLPPTAAPNPEHLREEALRHEKGLAFVPPLNLLSTKDVGQFLRIFGKQYKLRPDETLKTALVIALEDWVGGAPRSLDKHDFHRFYESILGLEIYDQVPGLAVFLIRSFHAVCPHLSVSELLKILRQTEKHPGDSRLYHKAALIQLSHKLISSTPEELVFLLSIQGQLPEDELLARQLGVALSMQYPLLSVGQRIEVLENFSQIPYTCHLFMTKFADQVASLVLTNEQTIRILSSFASLELVFPGVQRALKAWVCEGFPKVFHRDQSAENAQQINEILGNLCLLDIYEEELVEYLKDPWFLEPAYFPPGYVELVGLFLARSHIWAPLPAVLACVDATSFHQGSFKMLQFLTLLAVQWREIGATSHDYLLELLSLLKAQSLSDLRTLVVCLNRLPQEYATNLKEWAGVYHDLVGQGQLDGPNLLVICRSFIVLRAFEDQDFWVKFLQTCVRQATVEAPDLPVERGIVDFYETLFLSRDYPELRPIEGSNLVFNSFKANRSLEELEIWKSFQVLRSDTHVYFLAEGVDQILLKGSWAETSWLAFKLRVLTAIFPDSQVEPLCAETLHPKNR